MALPATMLAHRLGILEGSSLLALDFVAGENVLPKISFTTKSKSFLLLKNTYLIKVVKVIKDSNEWRIYCDLTGQNTQAFLRL